MGTYRYNFSLHYTCVFFLIISSQIFAQPDTTWSRIYDNGYNDYGYGVRQTTDGGFISVGTLQYDLSGQRDIWLIKTTANGDTLWTRTYGGENSETAYKVEQTADGGYLLAGISSTGNGKPLLIKTDANGDLMWTHEYGFDNWYQSKALNLHLSSQGSTVLTGMQGVNPDGNEDLFLLNVDGIGDTVWSKVYGGPGFERGNSVSGTSDGGYIICGYYGYQYSSSSSLLWLLRTDNNGDTLWTRKFADGYNSVVGKSVRQTSDNGFIITGYSGTFGENGLSKLLLMKTDENGDTLWVKYFYNNGKGYEVQQTPDGGYIIAGTVNEGTSNQDIVILKTDANGNKVWDRIYSTTNEDRAYAIDQTSDNGFIVTGMWNYRSNVHYSDFILMRLGPDVTSIAEEEPVTSKNFQLLQNYPNPFNPRTTIQFILPTASDVKITVFNINGELVSILKKQKLAAGHHQLVFDATNFASGIYLYRIQAGEFRQVRKMMLIK